MDIRGMIMSWVCAFMLCFYQLRVLFFDAQPHAPALAAPVVHRCIEGAVAPAVAVPKCENPVLDSGCGAVAVSPIEPEVAVKVPSTVLTPPPEPEAVIENVFATVQLWRNSVAGDLPPIPVLGTQIDQAMHIARLKDLVGKYGVSTMIVGRVIHLDQRPWSTYTNYDIADKYDIVRVKIVSAALDLILWADLLQRVIGLLRVIGVTELDLASCDLRAEYIEGFATLPLTRLSLGCTKTLPGFLSELHNWEAGKTLTYLNVGDNHLYQPDVEAISKLPNLKKLSVANCKLPKVSIEFLLRSDLAPKLEFLKIDNNILADDKRDVLDLYSQRNLPCMLFM